MTHEQTSMLLDKALNIIIGLEDIADEETKQLIEELFEEVKYTDELDSEM